MSSANITRPSPNSIQINEDIILEWKPGTSRTVDVVPDHVDGRDVVGISTGEGQGWIRLRIGPNGDTGNVFGARVVLRVDSSARVKPYILQVHDRSLKHIEAKGIRWGSLPLENASWFAIAGAFAVHHLPADHHFELIVDLPSNAKILLANYELTPFATTQSAKDEPHTSEYCVLEAISSFEARKINDVNEWLKHPALFASSFKVSNGNLSGWALTKAKHLYVAPDAGAMRLRIALDSQHALFDDITLTTGSLNIPIETTEHLGVYSLPKGGAPLWSGAVQASLTLSPARKSDHARTRQDHVILIWAPISISGLTIQLEQITEILKKLKFDFQISYHIAPRIDHPLCKYWIDPKDIDQPKMVLYMERFVAFDRGFEGAFKVFYMNLDWLAEKTRSIARVHADIVICPTPYLLDDLVQEFPNSKVVYLPWPSKFEVQRTNVPRLEKKARVLYIGNDYDAVSRKHPFEVIEAILRLERDDLIFDLKFRSPLPVDIRAQLESNPRVDKIIDWSTNHAEVETLYSTADLNLIPNACEGNGLSILESWTKGAVPAVLDGHPMKDVTRDQNSFRIPCQEVGNQERAPLYQASADQIYDFLTDLDLNVLQDKKSNVHKMDNLLNKRHIDLEAALSSFAMMSGIRTRGIRLRVEEAHLPSTRHKDTKPRSGDRVRDLMLHDEGQKKFGRPARLVDVIMTTSQRPWCLRQSLDHLMRAMHASPYEHRLFLLVDTLDPGTMAIISQYSAEIEQVLWTRSCHGLPYMWNTARDLVRNTINRTERRPSYICYIQDDCLIVDPDTYFEKMVGLATDVMPGYLGLVSGFYTQVHPGFADFIWKDEPVIASDSIDGKNFMATPGVIESIGPLTWWFHDGMRRGNPGPVRGSHFDLWQWKESENSLFTQKRISLVLPRLCRHIAEKAEDSTWNNDTTKEATDQRIAINKVYTTRK